MTKTDMMIRYEETTGKPSTRFITDGVHSVGIEVWHYDYINWMVKQVEEYYALLEKIKRMLPKEETTVNPDVKVDVSRKVKKASEIDASKCPQCGGGTSTYRHPGAKRWCDACGFVLKEEGLDAPFRYIDEDGIIVFTEG